MNDPPWLHQDKRELVKLIFLSHQKAFKYELMKCQNISDSYRHKSQELFFLDSPVLAHSNTKDPLITYANAKALQLWGRQWKIMVGMPSRLTAPKDQQDKRQATLHLANQKNGINGLQGIRVNQNGRKFKISNIRLWTLWDEDEHPIGQAATFSDWWFL